MFSHQAHLVYNYLSICQQDLKKYFDSSGGSISPKTVQVRSDARVDHICRASLSTVHSPVFNFPTKFNMLQWQPECLCVQINAVNRTGFWFSLSVDMESI